MKEKEEKLRLSIFDPTGNITALVESPVAEREQSAAAAEIMARFPEVEQVGFVRLPKEGGPVELRMAGGEFCGNASMSAAALYLLRRGEKGCAGVAETVTLRVTGVSRAVEVRLRREEEKSFFASVRMPGAGSVTEQPFPFDGLRDPLTVVHMEGIAHALITPASGFFSLRDNKSAAEEAARQLCAVLGAEALGLMFVEGEAPRLRLTPLVFVPGSGTLCWENSCASGSAAVGMALSARGGAPVRLELCEPGGTLSVESAYPAGEVFLQGRTRLVSETGL